jgi:hypothetical protein
MDRAVRLLSLSAALVVSAAMAASTSSRAIFWLSLLLAGAAAGALWRVLQERRR